MKDIDIGVFTFLHDSQIMKMPDQKVTWDQAESGMAEILQILSSSKLHALTPPPTIYSRPSLKGNVTPVTAFDSNICHLSLEEEAKREKKKEVLMMLAKDRSWVPGGKRHQYFFAQLCWWGDHRVLELPWFHLILSKMVTWSHDLRSEIQQRGLNHIWFHLISPVTGFTWFHLVTWFHLISSIHLI